MTDNNSCSKCGQQLDADENANDLFYTLNDLEMKLCNILDMDWLTCNYGDSLKAVVNLKEGRPIQEGIDDWEVKFLKLPLDKD
jgi:hypothetical protein